MTRKQAKNWHYVMVALCFGLLIAVKLSNDYRVRYRRQYVEDIQFMGRLSDNKDNRRFLVKVFGQALHNSPTANYVGIVWDFTDGPYQGRKEVGFDRKEGVVWVYFYVGANRDFKNAKGCKIGSEIGVQSMIARILSNKQIWPEIESTTMWGW